MNEERKKALQNLKTARGQIDGIIKMIADERYCVDIANQILASTALLKKANMHILTGHLDSCMKKAAQCPEDFDEKLLEIESIFKKMMR